MQSIPVYLPILLLAASLVGGCGNSASKPHTPAAPTPEVTAQAVTTTYRWPLQAFDISSEFGARNSRHKGIDLRAPRGTHILAAATGNVIFAGQQRGYGNVLILQHANGSKTVYAHNDRHLVTRGSTVFQGTPVATVGRTGNATGYHLHFELRFDGQKLNPRSFLPALR